MTSRKSSSKITYKVFSELNINIVHQFSNMIYMKLLTC